MMLHKAMLSVVIASLLTGCGLMPRTGEPSMALQVADEMEVKTTDMSRDNYERLAKDTGTFSDSGVNATMAQGVLMSDPKLILVGGFLPRSVPSYVHYTAWVPQSQAADGDAAVKVAQKAFLEALASIQPTAEAKAQTLNSGAPYTMGVPYGDNNGLMQPFVQLKQLTVGFTPKLAPAPAFMNNTGQVYGPIFVGVGTSYNNAEGAARVNKLASALPEWFYVYDPGLRGVAPRAVHNNGERLLFVSPK